MLPLDAVISIFESNQLEEFISGYGLEQLELCWANSLVQCDYREKRRLILALIDAGIDCDLRNEQQLTPVEQALGHDAHLMLDMLITEANKWSTQDMVYRLVRRGNVEILKMFWKLREVSEMEQFCSISLALEELRMKGVPEREDMINYCLKVLLKVFYSSDDCRVVSQQDRNESIGERLQIIMDEIGFLSKFVNDDYIDINDELLASLKIISENLYLIDLMWNDDMELLGPRWLWSRLRPRKCIFCLEIFYVINTEVKIDQEYYAMLLDKKFILQLLENLAREIKTIVNSRIEDRQLDGSLDRDLLEMVAKFDKPHHWDAKLHAFLRDYWYNMHPRVRLRKKTIQMAVEIVRKKRKQNASGSLFRPSLSCKSKRLMKLLDRRYDHLKSLYSINRMLAAIQAVKDIALTERVAKQYAYFAFRRVFAVIGESIKCTAATHNLNANLRSIMSRQSTRRVVRIYEQQRDKLAHGISLTDVNLRIRIEENDLPNNVLLQYCKAAQENLRRQYLNLSFHLNFVLLRTVRFGLGRLMQLKSVQQCKSLCEMVCGVIDPTQTLSGEVSPFDFNVINELFGKLSVSSLSDAHLACVVEMWEDVRAAQRDIRKHGCDLQEYMKAVRGEFFRNRFADDLIFLKNKVKLLLVDAFDYYHIKSLGKIRKTNEKMAEMLYSPDIQVDTLKIMYSLNQSLANMERKSIEMSEIHMGQFILHQNELYTEEILNQLGVSLDTQKFYKLHDALGSRVYDPLSNRFVANVFAIDKKFQIWETLLREQKIRYNPTVLASARKKDESKFYRLFLQMVQYLSDLNSLEVCQKNEDARNLAIEICLLELCQVLEHTAPFRKRHDWLSVPTPLACGHMLRNVLAHDAVNVASFIDCSQRVLSLTVEVFDELRHKLFQRNEMTFKLPKFSSKAKYVRRKRFMTEQNHVLDLGVDSMLLHRNPRLEIYGRWLNIRPDFKTRWYNYLDVIILRNPNEAIDYMEDKQASTVFEYVWKRVGYSVFFGYYLCHDFLKNVKLTKVINGIPFDITLLPETAASLIKPRRSNFLNSKASLSRTFKTKEILNICMITGQLNRFSAIYAGNSEKFDLLSNSDFRSPHLVESLASILPWKTTNDQGQNLIHLLCMTNNQTSLTRALELAETEPLIDAKDVLGNTPMHVAALNGYMSVVSILLKAKPSSMPPDCLPWMVLGHQNDFLKHFDYEGISLDQLVGTLRCFIGSSGNVESLHLFRHFIEASTYSKLFGREGFSAVLHYAFRSQRKHHFEHLLDISRTLSLTASDWFNVLKNTKTGKFKYLCNLLANGLETDFNTISMIAAQNCFKWIKHIYSHNNVQLSDEDIQYILDTLAHSDLDLKLHNFFIAQLSLKIIPLSLLQKALHRHSFKSVRFLCETFPSAWIECCERSEFHPILMAFNAVERWNSLRQSKTFLKFLIETCPNIHTQRSILHGAIQFGDLDIVRHLLAKKAPLDQEDAGFTPLAVAAHYLITENVKPSIFEELLKRGASLEFLLNKKPHYFFQLKFLENLLNTPSFFDPTLIHPNCSVVHNVCHMGSVRILKMLVEERHLDIHLLYRGSSVLDACIYGNSLSALRYLLPRIKQPACILTALVEAIRHDNVAAVRVILPYVAESNGSKFLESLAEAAHRARKLRVFIYFFHLAVQRPEP
ncbi:uncharacterized protein LOC129752294 [Uranotaenia lowii]|uniref:uncharacterized protein LOC129752294 n=1 Tax=Uranotaenia lowii TaxID=190385 RepID=UPI00247976E5|nr:uncharacterized protein LOC129752294 [Uranotaenia lowii]